MTVGQQNYCFLGSKCLACFADRDLGASRLVDLSTGTEYGQEARYSTTSWPEKTTGFCGNFESIILNMWHQLFASRRAIVFFFLILLDLVLACFGCLSCRFRRHRKVSPDILGVWAQVQMVTRPDAACVLKGNEHKSNQKQPCQCFCWCFLSKKTFVTYPYCSCMYISCGLSISHLHAFPSKVRANNWFWRLNLA